MEKILSEQVEAPQGQAETTAPPVQQSAPNAATEIGSQQAWYGTIEDAELKSWAENKGFTDPVTALKSYRNLETMMGKDRLSVPDAEKLNEWDGWDALGAPKEAEGYKETVKMPELPDGMALDETLVAQAFETGAAERIPASHMQKMLDLYAEHQKGIYEAAKQADETDRAELDALYKEWGAETEAMKDAARRAGAFFGLDGETLSEMNGVLGSAKMMQAFAKMGKSMQEGGLIGGNSGGLSPDAARQEMARFRADPVAVAAVRDSSHPQHAEYKRRFDELSKASIG